MKNAKRIIGLCIVAVCAILMHSCDWSKKYFIPSYIEGYYFYNGIAVKRALASTSTKHLHLQCNLTTCVWYLSEGEEKAMYDKLCRMYGDTAYNKTEMRIDAYPKTVTMYPHFTRIEVVSDKDFDAEHPAGTSLNDVMSIRYESGKKFIENNYIGDHPYFTEESKRLSELTADELMYCISNMFLVFDKEPDELETHTLAITCIAADGEKYSVEYKYDFTLPEGVIKGERK